MLVRNISDHARWVASPTHDFESADVEPAGEVEVPDALGKSLCEQADIWERVKSKTTAKAADEGEK